MNTSSRAAAGQPPPLTTAAGTRGPTAGRGGGRSRCRGGGRSHGRGTTTWRLRSSSNLSHMWGKKIRHHPFKSNIPIIGTRGRTKYGKPYHSSVSLGGGRTGTA